MLDDNAIKEELSYAYVHAIASRAGFGCERVRIDRDSVDVTVCARRKLADDSTLLSPKLDMQLKATSVPKEQRSHFTFSVPLRAYEDLRGNTLVPRILVLLVLPRKKNEWLAHGKESLVAKRCAYWQSLKGLPASANTVGVTVRVPKRNVLSPRSLKKLLIQVSREEEILNAG